MADNTALAVKADVPVIVPVAQEMGRSFDLSSLSGLVVRQQFQGGEALAAVVGVPLEFKNRYKIGPMPEGKTAKVSSYGPGWTPTSSELNSMQPYMLAQEQSSCLERTFLNYCGCGNLRNLKLQFTAGEMGYVPDGTVMGNSLMEMTRPFACGGWICCPLTSTVTVRGSAGQPMMLGQVREDFANYPLRCCEAACCCTGYEDVYTGAEKKYTIRVDQCCFRGNSFNCCGASPFNPNMVFDILDNQGKVVGKLQKTYGGDLGKCCFQFSQYVLEFPKDASHEDRAMLLAALHHTDYHFFEKSGNE